MSAEFANRVVMVSGAVGDVGQAVCHKFAADGARLILLARDEAKLNALAQTLDEQHKTQAQIIAVDATDPAAVDEAIRNIEAKFGNIDVLAHTIGGFEMGDPVHEISLDVVEKMFNLNVRPIYTLCGRVAKHMLAQETGGKIVVVAARAALKGSANASAYNASKAAAQSITESMALELRNHSINVNAVLPSIIDTPANRHAMPKADFAKWVTPDDVANAIYFLASESAKSLYGVSLEVYGRA